MIKVNRNNLLSSKKMSVESAYDLFVKSRETACSKATIGIYNFQRKQIVTPLSEAECMEDVTPDMIRGLLKDFGQTHNTGGTFRLFSSIRAFFNWYWDEFELDLKNPIKKVVCKKPSITPIPGISRDEINKMLRSIDKISKFPERDRVFISLLADTGVRKSSIVNLKFSDVDVENCNILVYEKDQNFHTKPFGRETQRLIRKYLRCLSGNKPDDCFWVNHRGAKFTASGIEQMMERTADVAGIPRYGFHAYRRFYGLELYKTTHDIYFVSRALDHKNIEVTKRYLAITDAEDAEAIRAMSPMDNKATVTVKRKGK